jgi:hypothetical protein
MLLGGFMNSSRSAMLKICAPLYAVDQSSFMDVVFEPTASLFSFEVRVEDSFKQHTREHPAERTLFGCSAASHSVSAQLDLLDDALCISWHGHYWAGNMFLRQLSEAENSGWLIEAWVFMIDISTLTCFLKLFYCVSLH